MAETVALKINVDAGDSAKTLGQLESRAEELNEEMRKVPLGSKAFKELKQELIGVNKEIKNTELSMEALDNEQVASELGSVAGAVGDMTAAFVLLGGEGGALEETAQNIEKALGISMAFKGAIEGVISFQKLWNSTLKNTAVVQGIVTGAQKLWNFVTQASTVALKGLRAALISTGIGAIVVAVGLLVANFDKLKRALGGLTKRQKMLNETMEEYKEGMKSAIQETTEMKATFDLAKSGVISKEEALEKYNTTLGDSFGKAKNLNEAEQLFVDKTDAYIKAQGLRAQASVLFEKAAEEQTNTIIAGMEDQRNFAEKSVGWLNNAVANVIDYSTAGFTDLAGESEKLNNAIAKSKENQVKKDSETRATAFEQLATDLLKQAELIENENEIISEGENELNKNRLEKAKKLKEEKEKLVAERLEREKQAIFDLQVAQKQADAEDILDEKEKAEALIEIERFKHEKELENTKLTNAEKELLEFEYQQKIVEISQKFLDEEHEREQKEIERLAELQKTKEEKEKEAREKKLEADKESAEKRLELEKRIEEEKFNLALGGIDALIQLNDAFQGQTEAQQKKAFERNKKLQIAQALISASQGIVNILSNASTIPDPFGTIYKVGQIGILAGVTAAQISKISQAQFSGGGTLNTPNVNGTGGGQAPQLSPITNTSTLVPQEPQQVFVTETDITQTQNKVAVIEEQATIK